MFLSVFSYFLQKKKKNVEQAFLLSQYHDTDVTQLYS